MPGTTDDPEALERGTVIHALLETLPALPPERWESHAEAAHGEMGLALLSQARALIADPDLREVFGPQSQAEVAFNATLGGRQITGAIDRLIVHPDRVVIVDFKSNALEPGDATQVPDGLLRQMGAYAAAMSQIFPDHSIEVAILWTGSGRLIRLPHTLVMDALQSGLNA